MKVEMWGGKNEQDYKNILLKIYHIAGGFLVVFVFIGEAFVNKIMF